MAHMHVCESVCACVQLVCVLRSHNPLVLMEWGSSWGSRARLCLLQQPLFYQVKLRLRGSWCVLILADNLGKSVCLLNIFTFFVKSHSLSYVAGWFDHRPVCLIDWLTEWLSDLMLQREAILHWPFVFGCRRKLLGWEESRKDGAVNRESLCSLERVRVRVPTQQWDASLNLLYFIACLFFPGYAEL